MLCAPLQDASAVCVLLPCGMETKRFWASCFWWGVPGFPLSVWTGGSLGRKHSSYAAAESCYYSSPLCCSFRDGSVNFFCSMPKFRFGWGGLALSLSFHILVFLIKNVAGSRCSWLRVRKASQLWGLPAYLWLKMVLFSELRNVEGTVHSASLS